MEFLKVSWEELAKECIALVDQVRDKKINAIICISRGGLVQGRILSDILDIPLLNISLTFYKDLKKQEEPIITQYLPEEYKNESVLLVDGVSDTGKTFAKAVSYLQTLPIQKIYTLAPYIKSQTTFIPDFWKVKTDKWIIFPYEIMETRK